MQAKVKATGEIVEIYFSPTNCMEAGGKRLWKTYELEFPQLSQTQSTHFLQRRSLTHCLRWKCLMTRKV